MTFNSKDNSYPINSILTFCPYLILEIQYQHKDSSISIHKISFLNPEKLTNLYKNPLAISEETFIQRFQKFFQKNPHQWNELIQEEDRKKWKEILKKLPQQKQISFMIRIFHNPAFLWESEKLSKQNPNRKESVSIFCNLFLLESRDIQKALLFILDTTQKDYVLNFIPYQFPIGIFLYRKTFQFVNEKFCEITEYTEEELYQLPPWYIIHESIQPKFKRILTRREEKKLKEKSYMDIPIQTKSKKIKWIQLYTHRILCQGEYHRLGMIIDITSKKEQEIKAQKLNHLYNTLTLINELLIKAQTEKEIFEKLCKILVQSEQFPLVWIGHKKEHSQSITPIHSYAKSEQLLKNINLYITTQISMIMDSIQKNKIIFVHTSHSSSQDFHFVIKNFKSFASIPIQTSEDSFSINLYSHIDHFFDEEEMELLKKIKANIEFALLKLYQKQWLTTYFTILDNAPVFFFITDKNNQIIYANPYTEKISGYSFDELQKQDPRIFSSHLHSKQFYKQLWDTILRKEPFSELFVNRKKNGELFYIKQTIIPIIENDQIVQYASIGIDLTEKINLESRLQISFLYDPITNLPNRKFFLEEVQSYIDMNQFSNPLNSNITNFAFIAIDLFRFHYINELYGTEVGDLYLKAFSQILIETLKKFNIKYLLSRTGNDEFLIFVTSPSQHISKENLIYNLLENLQNQSKLNYTIKDNLKLNFSYHVGISLFPEDFENQNNTLSPESIPNIIHTMMQNVDTALFEAKKEKEFSFRFYQTKMENQIKNFIFIKQHYYSAIENDEFVMFYQPYYEIHNSNLYGAEALIRWFHKGKIIPPNHFIPYLEETGQLIEIEGIIFDKVFHFYKYLQEKNIHIKISINISPISLYYKDFVKRIIEKIQTSNIKANHLVFEITETALIQDFDKVEDIITELKKTGIIFALDDFGTGYSSLGYLEKLPIEILKIDRSLIQELPNNNKKIFILETIIHLSQKLNFLTVAEGIETKEELEIVKNLGCNYVQGFLFAKPMKENEILSLIDTSNQNSKR